MAKVKNISGQDLAVPELGWVHVAAGETVDVPDERLWAYLCQTANWDAGDSASKRAYAAHLKAEEEASAGTEPAPVAAEVSETVPDAEPAPN